MGDLFLWFSDLGGETSKCESIVMPQLRTDYDEMLGLTLRDEV